MEMFLNIKIDGVIVYEMKIVFTYFLFCLRGWQMDILFDPRCG